MRGIREIMAYSEKILKKRRFTAKIFYKFDEALIKIQYNKYKNIKHRL